jgi:adenylate kinase
MNTPSELNVILLGPPGAGKGTQAAQIKRRWQIPHISTGAMLRAAIQAGTPLGLEVKQTIEGGGLIDDDLMTRLVRDRLGDPDAAAGFLLDGYPRTVPQARALDQILERRPLIIVEIVLSESEVLHRLASRLVCEECGTNAQDTGANPSCHNCGGRLVPRADDAEAVVRNRLDVYRRQTEPLVEYYSGRPTFHRINGAQLPDDVTADIVRAAESTWRAKKGSHPEPARAPNKENREP